MALTTLDTEGALPDDYGDGRKLSEKDAKEAWQAIDWTSSKKVIEKSFATVPTLRPRNNWFGKEEATQMTG